MDKNLIRNVNLPKSVYLVILLHCPLFLFSTLFLVKQGEVSWEVFERWRGTGMKKVKIFIIGKIADCRNKYLVVTYMSLNVLHIHTNTY